MQMNLSNTHSIPAARWLALWLALACTGAGAQVTPEIDALETAAQRGDVQALTTLASRYERGENVARDFTKSNELYCKAAARGDASCGGRYDRGPKESAGSCSMPARPFGHPPAPARLESSWDPNGTDPAVPRFDSRALE